MNNGSSSFVPSSNCNMVQIQTNQFNTLMDTSATSACSSHGQNTGAVADLLHQDHQSSANSGDQHQNTGLLHFDFDFDLSALRKTLKTSTTTSQRIDESGYQSVLARSSHSAYGTGWMVADNMSVASNNSQDDWDGLMNLGNDKIKIKDLSDLLASRYAFLSGAKTSDGSPILTFADSHSHLVYSDYCKLVTYLTQVPAFEDSHKGYVVIIDRRLDKWASVRLLLLHLSNYFPFTLRLVFVLKPEGVLQRALEMGYRSLADNCSFQTVICQNSADLKQWICGDRLTLDLGGNLNYCHLEWVQNRMDIERMKASATVIAASLDEFSRCLKDTELPNDVTTTSHVLDTQKCEREAIKEDFRIAVRKGLSLLKNIRQVERKPRPEQLSPTRLHNVTAVERMLIQLEETERSFDRFWVKHERRLQQCLELRRFEDQFRKLQSAFAKHMLYLEEHREVGDCVEKAERLMNIHDTYMVTAMEDVRSSEQLHQTGLELMNDADSELDGSLRPKCAELHRMSEALTGAVQRRMDVLALSRDMHTQIKQANDWCERGVDLLSRETAPNESQKQVSQLDCLDTLISDGAMLDLSALQFDGDVDNAMLLTTTDTGTLLNQVSARINDVRRMMECRKRNLQRLMHARNERPVIAVSPEKQRRTSPPKDDSPPPVPKHLHAQASLDSSQFHAHEKQLAVSSTSSFDLRLGLGAATPSSSEPSPQNESHTDSPRTPGPRRSPNQHPKAPILHSSRSETDALVLGHNLQSSHSSSPNHHKDTSHFIITELVNTEQSYVEELSQLLEHYVRNFSAYASAIFLPPNACQVIFGNLPELYDFHQRVFLKDLELAASHNQTTAAAAVARCFLDRRDHFSLYDVYCQNKPQSEHLRQIYGVQLAKMFQKCQEQAGHRLPLGAYLLKPVQRITKYQLLLKELERHCPRSSQPDVTAALGVMLDKLQQLNASMHQAQIVSYPGDLHSLGCVLMQGRFNVWTAKGSTQHSNQLNDRSMKLSRNRKMQQRHVFLFAKALVFCKRRPQSPAHHQAANDVYEYKLDVPISALTLNETVKNQAHKFELWSSAKSELYTMQPVDIQTRADWLVKLHSIINAKGEVQQRRVDRPHSWAELEFSANQSAGSNRSSSELSATSEPNEQTPRFSLPIDDTTNNNTNTEQGTEALLTTVTLDNSPSTVHSDRNRGNSNHLVGMATLFD